MAEFEDINWDDAPTTYQKGVLENIAQRWNTGVEPEKITKDFDLGERALVNRLDFLREQGALSKKGRERLIQKEARNFPNQTEQRLEAILRTVNSEFKQALTLITDKTPRGPTELYHRIEKHVNSKTCFSRTNTLPLLEKTLFPIGNVVQQTIGHTLDKDIKKWSLSDTGKAIGQPIAAYSLHTAVEQETSIFTVLGSTKSPGEQGRSAPYTRARILETLHNEDDKLPLQTIAKQIATSEGNVQNNLRALAENGIVDYRRNKLQDKEDNRHITYKRTDEYPGTTSDLPDLVSEKLLDTVLEFFDENTSGTATEIANETGYAKVSVRNLLPYLSEQDVITAVDDGSASLNPEATWAVDYIRNIRSAIENPRGKTIEYMRDIQNQLTDDSDTLSDYLQRGFELYRRVSPDVNRVPRSNHYPTIVNTLKNTGHLPTTRINEETEISPSRTRVLVQDLQSKDIIVKMKTAYADNLYQLTADMPAPSVDPETLQPENVKALERQYT